MAPPRLSPPVRAFLDALVGVDSRACVGGASALALHLGREPASPVVLLVGRSHRIPVSLGGAAQLRRSARAPVSSVAGVRVEPQLAAFLRVLGGPGAEQDVVLIAQTARALGDADRAHLARLAGRVRCRAAIARAAYLVARATGSAMHARPASAPVWLRPGGVKAGPVDRATGVRVNAPPGLALDPSEERDLARAVAAWLDPADRSLLSLAAAGLPLDETLAHAALGPGPWRVRLDELARAGLLSRDERGLRAVAPFDAPRTFPPLPTVIDRVLAALDASPDVERRAVGIDVRARLGRADVVAHALAGAPSALERGEVARVEAWLTAITPLDPARARSMHAWVLERRGRLAEALAVVREALVSSEPDGRAALLVDRARLAWRAGRSDEARAALRALAREVDHDRAGAVRVEAEVLRATMALERGDARRARAHLVRARASAEETGDDEALARVLRRAGTLEARAGRPGPAGGAYRAALVALRRARPVRDPGLEATLLANLATTESWLGHYAEADALYREALARRAGQPIETLNTQAALALLAATRGRWSAEGSFGALSDEAEYLGEPRLRAELAMYRAEELAREGRIGEAEDSLARVRAALAELGGAEVVLEAMGEAAEGLVRARRGERAGIVLLGRAVAALEGAGARYHAARTARQAAAAALWLGDEDGALRWVEDAARLSEEAGVVLGLVDRSHVGSLVLAALHGGAKGRAHATEILTRAGDLRVAAWLHGEGRADLAARWVGRPRSERTGPPYQALGPDGVQPLFPVGRDALLARTDVIVLDREQHRLHVPGRPPRPLDRMRLVEPLLALLAARRPEPVPIEEIARVLWGQRSSASVITAITTSIARLRKLLAPFDAVRTVGNGPRRAYAIRADALLFALQRHGGH